MIKLSIEQAKTLNTKRLLTYYKKYGHSWVSKYYCSSCGSFLCKDGFSQQDRIDYVEEFAYWFKIKEILSTREHIHNNETKSTEKH